MRLLYLKTTCDTILLPQLSAYSEGVSMLMAPEVMTLLLLAMAFFGGLAAALTFYRPSATRAPRALLVCAGGCAMLFFMRVIFGVNPPPPTGMLAAVNLPLFLFALSFGLLGAYRLGAATPRTYRPDSL
jgi:hypothetical protein